MQNKLEKIDRFIDKILSWNFLKYTLLGYLAVIPNALIATRYNIPSVLLIVMNLSFGVGTHFFAKSIKDFTNT